jgi:hypothetical protein
MFQYINRPFTYNIYTQLQKKYIVAYRPVVRQRPRNKQLYNSRC